MQGVGPHLIAIEGQAWTPAALPPLEDGKALMLVWSWTSDGRKLAGAAVRNASQSGVYVYSLDSKQYEKITDAGSEPVWLTDNRRLLYRHDGKLFLADSASKKTREMLSVAPHEIPIRGFALSRDNRTIYFTLVTTEADIWLLAKE